MKTLLYAMLMSAGADGSAGGSPNEPNPNTNDAAQAANMVAEGAPVASTAGPEPIDLTELDEDFRARLEAERAEHARIRAETPVQEIELRLVAGTSKVGLVIGTPDGIRCIELADWRTDRICLKAGDNAHLVVLAGEGLRTWEFYRGQEERAKNPPQIQTVSVEPAAAAAILGATAASVAAVDPLEETLPAIGGTNGPGSDTKAVDPETLRDPDAVMNQS